MANVTFHRTSKKQEIIKQSLIKGGLISAEKVASYDGLELGDDDTIKLITPLEAYEVPEGAKCYINGENVNELAIVETYAIFSGRILKVAKEVRYCTSEEFNKDALVTLRSTDIT